MSSLFWPDKFDPPASDDRCAPRARLVIPARIRRDRVRSHQTLVLDLSLAGFSALASTRLDNGTQLWVALAGLPPRRADVIWWQGGLVGCAFTDLLNGEEYAALMGKFGGKKTTEH